MLKKSYRIEYGSELHALAHNLVKLSLAKESKVKRMFSSEESLARLDAELQLAENEFWLALKDYVEVAKEPPLTGMWEIVQTGVKYQVNQM